MPPAQVALPLAGAAHTLPQAPQLVASVWVSTHALPHFVKPVLHSKPQVPPTHLLVELGRFEQALLHAEQCSALV